MTLRRYTARWSTPLSASSRNGATPWTVLAIVERLWEPRQIVPATRPWRSIASQKQGQAPQLRRHAEGEGTCLAPCRVKLFRLAPYPVRL
jgi:hypothetical protein